MYSLKNLNNYHEDLCTSLNTPLLIELNKKDINSFNPSQGGLTPFTVARRVYDANLNKTSTNILAIDGNNLQHGNQFYLLDALFDQLTDELKAIKNLATLKETLKAAASVATAGLLDQFIGDYLDKGVDYLFDEVGDHFSELLVDTVADNIDVASLTSSSIEGMLQDSAGETLADFIAKASDNKLNLTLEEKEELYKLSTSFSKSAQHDVFQLTFKVMLAISLGSPKLIFVNNPYKLDNNSIAILSLIISYAKHQKELGIHLGLSILYTYTDGEFQPYSNVSDDLKQKQRLLDDQRRFAQRYAMLERPSSNIPKVAVKSSLFVGRIKELEQLQSQFYQRKGVVASVVSGEPGIGKTALVKQHIKQIETSKTITLTLLNEVGHSSTNTGLSSLEKSILEEAKRLELLKNWKEKGIAGLKDLANKDTAYKAIGMILSGSDKVLSIADSGYQRIMVDNHIDKVKQSGLKNLDNQPSNQKALQFNKLDKAIDALLPLSDPNQPLVLFIDDCQWIDNHSSEYILTRLAPKMPVYIVTTIRPSDAATLLKQHSQNKSLNEYSIALLKTFETKGHEEIVSTIDTSYLQLNSIHLSGFDKTALKALITSVIQGNSEQVNALTNTLFSEIAGQGEEYINTLFTIESINMLCDEKLYSENSTKPLILGKPLCFNSELIDISAAIKDTFTLLLEKYKSSLNQADKLGSFNLMAYAVLEERLHLLKLYFVEHGNAAVNTLLFSSLLGAPFSSSIVKASLEALSKTELPLLEPLRAHIQQGQLEVGLTAEHYSIIDEVYEILSRYQLNEDKYQYRHGLLHIFLSNQFESLITKLLKEQPQQAIEQVFEILLQVIEQEWQQQPFYRKSQETMSSVDTEQLIFFVITEQLILKQCLKINHYKWAARYSANLEGLASIYNNHNQLIEAIALYDEALLVRKDLYVKKPEQWAQSYTSCLGRLALSYVKNNQPEEAIKLEQESLALLKPLYEANPEQWADDYTVSLNNLSLSYQQNNQWPVAIETLKNAGPSLETLYEKRPERWAELYIARSNNLAQCYYSNNQITEAIERLKDASKWTETLYEKNPEQWTSRHTITLNNLAQCYRENHQLGKAISLEKVNVETYEILHEKNPEQWAGDYANSLNNLALSYITNQQLTEADELLNIALTNCKALYKKSPKQWVGHYTSNLSNLAATYLKINRVTEAIELIKEVSEIFQELYEEKPEQWVIDYIRSLGNLANTYQKNNQLTEAIELHKEALVLATTLYENNPKPSAGWYANSLNGLGASYHMNNQHAKAIGLFDRALAALKPLYDINPEQWASDYAKTLNRLSSSHSETNQLEHAITLAENAFRIHNNLYKKAPDQWVNSYTTSLSNLAKVLQKNNRMSEAIECNKEVVRVNKALYEKSPEQWSGDYANSLNTLATSYSENQLVEAISLFEQALRIQIELYDKNPKQWAGDYVNNLNNLSVRYQNNNQLAEAIQCSDISSEILEDLYKNNSQQWAYTYTSNLNNRASFYLANQQYKKSISLAKTSQAALKELYANNNRHWADSLINCQNLLATNYANIGELESAINIFKSCLDITIKYEKENREWTMKHVQTLGNLAYCYEQIDSIEESISTHKLLLVTIEDLYKKNQLQWKDSYISRISDLAQTYRRNYYIAEALDLESIQNSILS